MLRRIRSLVRSTLRPLARRAGAAPRTLPPEHWGLEVDRAGHLRFRGIDLPALLGAWGSPLHVVLGDRLQANARRFLDAASGRADVFYSYKTNPVPGVLRALHAAGAGAEVISELELRLALRLGVPPRRIVYNGPAKSPASIRTAIEEDILLLNLNHREEIAGVAAAARSAGRRPRVGLRVTTGLGWAGQFGVPIAGGQALRALEEAHATGDLDVCALHSHVGGMIRGKDEVRAHVAQVLAFADEVEARLGIRLRMLDLGGSLATPGVGHIDPLDLRLNRSFQRPLPAPDPAATLPIAEYVDTLASAVEAHYRGRGRSAPELLLEPGRSMTGDTQLLLASVLTINGKDPEAPWAILDAGINLAESMRSEYHQVLPASRMGEPASRPFRLAGPICSPGDVVRWAAPLPELQAGDVLAFMDAGAYFVPFSTSFSFPRPAIVMIEDGAVRPLRRAETFDDVTALDDPGPG